MPDSGKDRAEAYTVTILPEGIKSKVAPGLSIKKAALLAGIEMKSTCGEEGTCGKCVCRVMDGLERVEVKSTGRLSPSGLARGFRLACQSLVHGDVVVEIPSTSRLSAHQVLLDEIPVKDRKQELKEQGEREVASLSPLYSRVALKLAPPSLDDNTTDASRLLVAARRQLSSEGVFVPASEQASGDLSLDISVARTIPEALRGGNWAVEVGLADVDGRLELQEVLPSTAVGRSFGLAIDIGTTTVVVQLIDLADGRSAGVRGTYNQQAAFGDDVISRIVYTDEGEAQLEEIHRAVIDTINGLIDRLCDEVCVEPHEIKAAMWAGNTTMAHLFLGITPRWIRLEPYTPAFSRPPAVKAGELGLHIHTEARVQGFPSVGSYVGGDIISGVLAVELQETDEVTLFIDIGTNGEIVLGNRDWLLCCACSAGPAFEGAGLRYGMRAMQGAIERIRVDLAEDAVLYSAIGNARPVGICGSGLIDTVATLQEAGVIDRSGNFVPGLPTKRLRDSEAEGKEFVLVWSQDTGIGEDITITQADIKNLLRAKAAIFAGVRTLLRSVDMSTEDIGQVLIAGGFGSYLNIHDAVTIGLLPDLPPERYRYVGNSSLKGARLALLSRDARAKLQDVAARMTYVELSAATHYMDEFVSALFLPHTDLGIFPSVRGRDRGSRAVNS